MLPYITCLLAFIGMEGVAWFSHKYLMHGLFWFLHTDHHNKTNGTFERNDAFFLLFAIPSWLCIMLGLMNQVYSTVGIGTGIALYGLTYFLVHDVYIHGRFFKLPNIPLLNNVKRAHQIHHGNTGKEEGSFFGLISAPFFLKNNQ